MELFARFKKDLSLPNGEILFRKDDGTKGTRYLVLSSNNTEVYVATSPNNFKTNQASRFHVGEMDEVLFLVKEYE